VNVVDVVVPDGIDDPARPSGGNVYDRRICRGLAAAGWRVREHAVPGSWPISDAAAEQSLARVLGSVADGGAVLVDGLVACAAPDVLVPAARRLSLVVLVHMPLGDAPPGQALAGASARERAVLSAAGAVVTTSAWTRERLVERYGLRPERVHVAEPGADPAPPAPGTAGGSELLCVAAVIPDKGHDLLLAALAAIAELPWRCVCVGTLDRDPPFVDRLRRQAAADGVGDRFCFPGPYPAGELDRAYAAADALVLASRAETYGMVVTEALARGLPVVATAVGGLPDALGHAADGRRPGLLVPSGDRPALTGALRSWLSDAGLRQRLRQAAAQRRLMLPGWPAAAERVAQALAGAGPG
jgi:glycosyltransferase involved in cell wall biosynthesis